MFYGYELKTTHITREELCGLISERLRVSSVKTKEFRELAAVYTQLKNWGKLDGRSQNGRKKTLDPDAPDANTADIMALVRKLEKKREASYDDEEDEG
jgi:hypothetical protein